MTDKFLIPIGYLRTGDRFLLDGRKYKVGHSIKNAPGYVACTDITDPTNKKVTRWDIDVIVEKL